MDISPTTFLMICPLLFLAGLVDAIGGGGGLISLPAFLIAGIPPHQAIATNKMQAMCGTALATFRFIRKGFVNLTLAAPTILCAFIGSAVGSWLSLRMNEVLLEKALLFVLPVAAFIVFNKKWFMDNGNEKIVLSTKIIIIACCSALIVGVYDGFYGPGTGTFLILAFTLFTGMGVRTANAQAKVINLTTNVTAFAVFALSGNVLYLLGFIGAVCNMAGGYIGAGLVLKNGGKIVRPSILFVLVLLVLKVLNVF